MQSPPAFLVFPSRHLLKLRRQSACWLVWLTAWGTALPACGQAAPPSAAPRRPAAAPAAKVSLLGRWQSAIDPLSEVEITPTRYLEKYQGKVTSTSTYQLGANCGCPDQKRVSVPQQVLTTRSQPDGDCYCYLLQQLTPTTLRLANYGQGGFLQFKRLK